MRQHINDLPYKSTDGLSWNPAAHFLRNYTNNYTKPNNTSSKYGAYDRSTVEHYINNPQNYPSGYISKYGLYRFPVVSRQQIEEDERDYPYQ